MSLLSWIPFELQVAIVGAAVIGLIYLVFVLFGLPAARTAAIWGTAAAAILLFASRPSGKGSPMRSIVQTRLPIRRSARLTRLALALSATLMLGGCATTTASSGATRTACGAFHAISWSARDTDETIRGVKAHNAAGRALCGWR